MSGSSRNYESAAKDIEQEKKMVAALKRLSIGNMISYDPDLPVETAEFQLKSEDASPQENNVHLNGSTSLSRKKSGIDRKKSLNIGSDSASILSNDNEYYDAEDTDPILDTSTNSLLWVPANLHPEVDPDQFKLHVQTTVEEIMERKLSRKSSVSNRSSVSSADDLNFNDGVENDKNTENKHILQQKRFSNPSLRDLTNELEKLSNLAGMSANDAVSLARSLSTSSVGYTEVEKQAFDEIKSPPRLSPNRSLNKWNDLDFDSDRPIDETSPTHRKSQRTHNNSRSADYFNPTDFSLKRSRRLDYRKSPSIPSTSHSSSLLGSNLQNNKQEKLAELRNNLNYDISGNVSNLSKKKYHHNARSSQYLFSYKNPNVNSSSTSIPSNEGSPYPSSASTHSPIENQLNAYHNSKPKKNLNIKLTQNSPYRSIQSQPKFTTKARGRSNSLRPSQAPPSQPYPENKSCDRVKHYHKSRTINSSIYSEVEFGFKEQAFVQKKSSPRQGTVQSSSHRYDNLPLGFHKRKVVHSEGIDSLKVPQINISTSKKSQQLTQNLDLLRSEIHEFKEKLTKASDDHHFDKPMSNKRSESPVSSDNNDSDFSFENSYQDVSYEDSLGIEKDVLQELQEEAISENKTDDIPNNSLDYEMQAGSVQIATSIGSTPRARLLLNDSDNSVIFADEKDGDLTLMETQAHVPESNAIHEQKETPKGNIKATTQELVNSVDNETSEIKNYPKINSNANNPFADKGISETHNYETPSEDCKSKHLVSHADLHEDFKIFHDEINSTLSESDLSDQSSTEVSPTEKDKKVFDNLSNNSTSSLNSEELLPGKRSLRKKKSWPWMRGRASSFSSVETNSLPPLPENASTVPMRSVSFPEVSSNSRPENSEEVEGKENVITKLFRRNKRQNQKNLNFNNTNNSFSNNSESQARAEESKESKKKSKKKTSTNIFKKSSYKSSQTIDVKLDKGLLSKYKSSDKEKDRNHDFDSDNLTSMEVYTDIANSIDDSSFDAHDEAVLDSSTVSIPKERTLLGQENPTDDHWSKKNNSNDQIEEPHKPEKCPQTTYEIQEKLRKSIKRTSKANQPIEFSDSAFGFPLPPPSNSTIVMLEHRFPVHVERAIYRLSHLKLANPKRSLKEQVLLSNFMYAYLNLVDHTLHLEQLNNNNQNNTFNLEKSNYELNFENDQNLQETIEENELDLDVDDIEQATEA